MQIDPKHREMIAGKLMPRRRLSATEIVLATVLVVNTRTLDRKILEGLELAQHEIFYIIKVSDKDKNIFKYFPFSSTVHDIYKLQSPYGIIVAYRCHVLYIFFFYICAFQISLYRPLS